MTESSRPRRVVGSRHPTGRPRKVAGQAPSTPPEDRPTTPEEPEQPEDPDAPGIPEVPEAPPTAPEAREPAPEGSEESDRRAGRWAIGGPRTTLALVVAVVVLAVVAALEVVYLVRDDEPTVSEARPVVTGEMGHRAAVEAAARSTEEILSTSYKNYDEQVDQAAAKMTGAFAKEYRKTAEDIADRFTAARTELQVKVVGQGVHRASSEQVQALLFLDQYVQKASDGRPTTDYRQYRALVTVVHTDQGWLVSEIDTK